MSTRDALHLHQFYGKAALLCTRTNAHAQLRCTTPSVPLL
jgi:hypothetical protein